MDAVLPCVGFERWLLGSIGGHALFSLFLLIDFAMSGTPILQILGQEIPRGLFVAPIFQFYATASPFKRRSRSAIGTVFGNF